MYTKETLCDKIHELHPQIGECNRDLTVAWNAELNAWAVDFKKDGQPIRHYLENADAAACLDDKKCIGMALEFGQFGLSD